MSNLENVVKLKLPERNDRGGVPVIYSHDRKIVMVVPYGTATKRLYPGERSAYFKYELNEDGILEIGERVPIPTPAW